LVLTAVLVAGSFMLVPFIGTEFMPKTETRELTMNLKLQEGTKLERTESTVNNLETILIDYLGSNLDKIYSHSGPTTSIAGDATSVFQGENTAQIRVILAENSTVSTGDVIVTMNLLTQNISGLDITFSEEQSALKSILGTDEAPVVVEVRGEELDEIESVVNQVKDRMMNIQGLFNIQTSVEDGAPEVEIHIDRIRAGMYNLDINTVIHKCRTSWRGKLQGKWNRAVKCATLP
jgi:hydrophobic/amphiphilic exporter-1 (mainly G- bacteria), HAE1 family